MTNRVDDRTLQALSRRIAANSKEVTSAQRSSAARAETLSRAYRKEAEGVQAARRAISSRARTSNIPPEEKLRDLGIMRRLLAERQGTAQTVARALGDSRNELAKLAELRRTLDSQGRRVMELVETRVADRRELRESSDTDDLSILSAIKDRIETDSLAREGDVFAKTRAEDTFITREGSAVVCDVLSRDSNEGRGESSRHDTIEREAGSTPHPPPEKDKEDSPQLSLQYQSREGEETAISLALEKDGTVSVDFSSSRTASAWVNSRRERRFQDALERAGIGVSHVSIVNRLSPKGV